MARRPNLRVNVLNTTQTQPVSISAFVPALLELVRGDAALLRELIGMFLEDCPQQVGNIRAAVRQRDAAGLRSAAHLLRGAIGNFGSSAAYEAARSLAVGTQQRIAFRVQTAGLYYLEVKLVHRTTNPVEYTLAVSLGQ